MIYGKQAGAVHAAQAVSEAQAMEPALLLPNNLIYVELEK